jgi:hypothetical protein
MIKKLSYKVLFFSVIFILFTFQGADAQDLNVENLYLVSSSKTVKIKAKKSVTLVTQNQMDDSTWKVSEQSGRIISFSDSVIVLRKKHSNETLYVNKTVTSDTRTYYNSKIDIKLNINDLVAMKYSPRSDVWLNIGSAFAIAGGLGLGIANPIAGLTKTDSNKEVFNGVLLGSVSSLAIGGVLAAIFNKEYYYSLNDSITHKYNCQCSESQQKKKLKKGFRLNLEK